MPYAIYQPGLDMPDLTDQQVADIDRILAVNTACKALPVIDPFEGVLPTVLPTGFNHRPWCEIRLEVYYAEDRIQDGESCANRIADQVSEVVGYIATVWMNVGGTFFQGRSDRA